jgi:hypothetical protein
MSPSVLLALLAVVTLGSGVQALCTSNATHVCVSVNSNGTRYMIKQNETLGYVSAPVPILLNAETVSFEIDSNCTLCASHLFGITPDSLGGPVANKSLNLLSSSRVNRNATLLKNPGDIGFFTRPSSLNQTFNPSSNQTASFFYQCFVHTNMGGPIFLSSNFSQGGNSTGNSTTTAPPATTAAPGANVTTAAPGTNITTVAPVVNTTVAPATTTLAPGQTTTTGSPSSPAEINATNTTTTTLAPGANATTTTTTLPPTTHAPGINATGCPARNSTFICVSHDGSNFLVDYGNGYISRGEIPVKAGQEITFQLDNPCTFCQSHSFKVTTSSSGGADGAPDLGSSPGIHFPGNSTSITPTKDQLNTGLYYQCGIHANEGGRITTSGAWQSAALSMAVAAMGVAVHLMSSKML